MYYQKKYLSHGWNKAAVKSKLQENVIYRKAKDETSSMHVFGHVVFALCIMIIAATGLRLTEENLTSTPASSQSPLAIKIVQAAEVKNAAAIQEQSHSKVNIRPDQAFTFILKYKNTGTSIWTKESFYLKSLSTSLVFKHKYWPDPYHPAQLQEKIVEPGEIGTFKFALKAPGKYKKYIGDFVLVNDNKMVKGGQTKVTMNVVEDPETYKEEIVPVVATPKATVPKLSVCNLKLNIANAGVDNVTCDKTFELPEEGPEINVGIINSDDPITIVNNKAWQIYDANDKLLASIKANEEKKFVFINSKQEFAFDHQSKTVRSLTALTLKNINEGMFEVTSHKDIPTWNKSINYNKYTGTLTLDYYEKKDRVWVIETVPLEQYLKGLKESSNPDPTEYQKALTIAARTYALYHVNKFAKEETFFDVYSDERDQVYKGYVAEEIMPNQSEVVDNTSGVIATHDNNIIISYYSARSGGHTLTHNSLAYLKSVQTPYSAKLGSMWGHGLGMDQQDAKARAKELGWTYDQILKYYYSGISLEKIY